MLVACEGSGPSRNGPGDGGGAHDAPMGTSADGVSIAAANVHQVGELESTPPSQGHYFVVLDMTLSNTGTKAAALDPVQFSLETAGGVAFIASPLTEGYTDPCDASASVEPNAMATCGLAFEIDSTSLSKLIYTLADGTMATVSVSLPGPGSGGSGGTGGWGAVCDTGNPCVSPFQCLDDGSGFASTCEPLCSGTSDSTCASTYTGSGDAECASSDGNGGSGACIVLCIGGTNQCPGALLCETDAGSAAGAGEQGFCLPPTD
jgi:hypothetical protein